MCTIPWRRARWEAGLRGQFVAPGVYGMAEKRFSNFVRPIINWKNESFVFFLFDGYRIRVFPNARCA